MLLGALQPGREGPADDDAAGIPSWASVQNVPTDDIQQILFHASQATGWGLMANMAQQLRTNWKSMKPGDRQAGALVADGRLWRSGSRLRS